MTFKNVMLILKPYLQFSSTKLEFLQGNKNKLLNVKSVFACDVCVAITLNTIPARMQIVKE